MNRDTSGDDTFHVKRRAPGGPPFSPIADSRRFPATTKRDQPVILSHKFPARNLDRIKSGSPRRSLSAGFGKNAE
jgi:hypothetical protein